MPAELRGVTVEGIRRVIDWLDSEQTPEAVVSHHGVGTRVGDFYARIAPGPPYGRDGGSVLIFDVPSSEWQKDGDGPHAEIVNGIPPRQRDSLQALVAEVCPVVSAWNGIGSGCTTCSFHIAREAGEGVKRARSNYVPFETRDTVVGIAPAPSTQEDDGNAD